MLTNKNQIFYLKDGKLDLSVLNEEVAKPPSSVLEEIESLEADVDISSTLEEVALMFEEEDRVKEAFNHERLEEEMKEFDKMD